MKRRSVLVDHAEPVFSVLSNMEVLKTYMFRIEKKLVSLEKWNTNTPENKVNKSITEIRIKFTLDQTFFLVSIIHVSITFKFQREDWNRGPSSRYATLWTWGLSNCYQKGNRHCKKHTFITVILHFWGCKPKALESHNFD